MNKIFFTLLLVCALTLSASATQIAVPPVPEEGEQVMPAQTGELSQGLWELVKNALAQGQPILASGLKLCLKLLAASLVLALIRSLDTRYAAMAELAGILAVGTLVLGDTRAMITLGTDTVWSISQYGKLLLPVMTAALAAQGGGVTAAALYGATAMFDSLLCSVISGVLVPMVYIYLVLALVNALTEDGMLKKLKNLFKWAMGWFFKLVLYVFTGYIAISGIISGSADQVAIKATKLTISGMIPVVGGILSDASETILVSAALVKNGAGIYGLLAVLAVTVLPFLTIGIHYLLLKVTAALGSVFVPKAVSALLEDLSGAMALVLGMVGAVCMIQLISVVCFLKGMT